MARGNRKDIVDPFKVRMYHCISQVVRLAWLLGCDPTSGKSYDHRKQWIEELTREFAQYFGIDIVAFAIMINHIHHQLRSRPDIVKNWTDLEVARRWLNICPGPRKKKKKLGKKAKSSDGGSPEQSADKGPTDEEILALSKNKKRIKTIRKRLSNVSWFMGKLKERIARRANAEDGVTGHFWAARFKCVRLDSEAACLACSVYIDLNMTRAGTATRPEDSYDTSIYMRIIGFQSRRHKYRRNKGSSKVPDPYDPEVDAFLAPIYKLDEAMSGKFAELGLRVSDKPCFDIDFNQYVDLVDKTGRQIVAGKQSIAADLPPVLDRLGISRDCWADKIQDFGNWTRRVVGTPADMENAAAEDGVQWYQGISHCRELFIGTPPPDPD